MPPARVGAVTSPPVDADAQLMVRVRNGDTEAFAPLVRKYRAPMIAYCARQVGDRFVGEELAQDVFLQAYGARHRYQPTARFATWLYTIATRLCLNELRRRGQERRHLGRRVAERYAREDLEQRSSVALGGDAHMRGVEAAERFELAISMLPPRQRTVFLLSRVEGLPHVEIASIVGISRGAVKAALSRALSTLARYVPSVVDDR